MPKSPFFLLRSLSSGGADDPVPVLGKQSPTRKREREGKTEEREREKEGKKGGGRVCAGSSSLLSCHSSGTPKKKREERKTE